MQPKKDNTKDLLASLRQIREDISGLGRIQKSSASALLEAAPEAAPEAKSAAAAPQATEQACVSHTDVSPAFVAATSTSTPQEHTVCSTEPATPRGTGTPRVDTTKLYHTQHFNSSGHQVFPAEALRRASLGLTAGARSEEYRELTRDRGEDEVPIKVGDSVERRIDGLWFAAVGGSCDQRCIYNNIYMHGQVHARAPMHPDTSNASYLQVVKDVVAGCMFQLEYKDDCHVESGVPRKDLRPVPDAPREGSSKDLLLRLPKEAMQRIVGHVCRAGGSATVGDASRHPR